MDIYWFFFFKSSIGLELCLSPRFRGELKKYKYVTASLVLSRLQVNLPRSFANFLITSCCPVALLISRYGAGTPTFCRVLVNLVKRDRKLIILFSSKQQTFPSGKKNLAKKHRKFSNLLNVCERNGGWREGVKKGDFSESDTWESVCYHLLSGTTRHEHISSLCVSFASIINEIRRLLKQGMMWCRTQDPKTIKRNTASLQTQICLHFQEAHWPRNLIVIRAGLYFVTVTTFQEGGRNPT